MKFTLSTLLPLTVALVACANSDREQNFLGQLTSAGNYCASPVFQPQETRSQADCSGIECTARRQLICGDACGMNNGLQYGRCYHLIFPESGQRVGRSPPSWDRYVEGGVLSNIVYKICNLTSPSACGDRPVQTSENFYIQDLFNPESVQWLGANPNGYVERVTGAAAIQFWGKTSRLGCHCTVLLGPLYKVPDASSQLNNLVYDNMSGANEGLDLLFDEVACI